MARITGSRPGLVPVRTQTSEPARQRVRQPKGGKRSGIVDLDPTCALCNGMREVRETGRFSRDEAVSLELRERMVEEFDLEDGQSVCAGCITFFQVDYRSMLGPRLPFDHTVALTRIGEARETGWVMVLRPDSFGAPSGASVTVERGDCFKTARVGAPNGGKCSTTHSRSYFSVDIQVGTEAVTLFPHEFSPVSWLLLMELREAGELEEQFISTEDATGYFAPTPEYRAQIDAMFGR